MAIVAGVTIATLKQREKSEHTADSRRRMQAIEVANRIRRKGSYHGKSIHPLAVRSSGHIACPPLVLRCPSIRTSQGDADDEGNLNSPSSSLRRDTPCAGSMRRRVRADPSLIPWAAGRKRKAGLLRIVHEESEIYLMEGTVR